MTALFTGLRAAVYGSGFVLLWGWLSLGARPLDAALGGPWPAWTRMVSTALMTVGAALAISCVALFVAKGRGTQAPFDPPRAFVASGAYRWVRNPMYLGGLAVLAGFGLWHRSPAMTLFTVAAALAFHLFVVLVEEPGLAARFGEPYLDYRRRVNRWLPRRPYAASLPTG